MLTTVDKAIAGGVVSFIANWLLAHYQITLPADVQTAMSGLIVAVVVWATPNVERQCRNLPRRPQIQPPNHKGNSMTSTDTTTTAPTELQQIEAALSADWANIVAFFKQAEADLADFLTAVATGAPVVIADVQSAANAVAGKVSVINAAVAAASTLAATVAPNNTTVQKLLNDVNAGVADAAALSNALQNGTSTSDPTIVTQAVTAINAVNTLSQLASVAAAALTTAVAASPTATQAVSPTPPAPAA